MGCRRRGLREVDRFGIQCQHLRDVGPPVAGGSFAFYPPPGVLALQAARVTAFGEAEGTRQLRGAPAAFLAGPLDQFRDGRVPRHPVTLPTWITRDYAGLHPGPCPGSAARRSLNITPQISEWLE